MRMTRKNFRRDRLESVRAFLLVGEEDRVQFGGLSRTPNFW